jgi:membrane fusion protein, copper/silver efflux system
MKNRYFKIISVLVSLLIVFILATALFTQVKANEDPGEEAAKTDHKKYVCSMHPQVIRDEPGDCPICGMFLIELVEQDKNMFDSSLTDVVLSVNKSVLGQLKGITPEQKALPIIVEVPGIINFDPGKSTTISARFGGYIERTFVKYQFQHITQGQKIYEIYSPDIYTERWNYVKLVQAYPDRDNLTREALEWFNNLGLSKGQIDSLKVAKIPDYHLPVYSQSEGYVVSRDYNLSSIDNQEPYTEGTGIAGFNDGITVEKGAALFNLIDIKSLRADLKVKTEDVTLLKKGQKVILTETGYPERQFTAFIDQIEPLNGGLFQTVKVFFRIKDKGELLLPGKKIIAQIFTGSHDGLWLPLAAVVETGQRNSVFIMKDNKYVATEVRTGVRSNDEIEILYGIDQNTIVAGKALLLIDSDGFINN